MHWEDPDALFRKKLGREEYCQRMLTSLIVGGPYPRWNSPSSPSSRGLQFLSRLHLMAFGEELESPPQFVDEFELPALAEDEKGGAPDYAIMWPGHLWLIELKTEVNSHRKDQLPFYVKLGHHNHPARRLKLLYLTPQMRKEIVEVPSDCQFAHLFWPEISGLMAEIWAKSPADQERLLEEAMQREIATLDAPARAFRQTAEVVRNALASALEVQRSGQQMAVEIAPSGLEDLIELRMRIRDTLRRVDGARNVRPWIWYASTSGGKALTSSGREVGCELRLSRYERADV